MQVSRAAWLLLGLAAGCSPVHSAALGCCTTEGTNPIDAGEVCSTDADCNDENACTEDTCVSGACAYKNKPARSMCEGAATDSIHGECNQDEPVCNIEPWGCFQNPPDGHPCLGSPCLTVAQCDFYQCVDTTCEAGVCVFRPEPSGSGCVGGRSCDGVGHCGGTVVFDGGTGG